MPRKKPRNYRKEYDEYHGTPAQRKNRAARNRARYKLKPGPGKEVDHKRPLSKGGTNAKSNLKVTTRTANRKRGAAIANANKKKKRSSKKK